MLDLLNGHKYAEAKETYADSKWHFVAQVGDDDKGYPYVDGEQITTADAGYLYSTKPYFIIGARSKNSGSDIDDVEYFKGFIDQIAVFSIALNGQEIKKIAAEAIAVSPSGKLTITWAAIKTDNVSCAIICSEYLFEVNHFDVEVDVEIVN